MLVVSNCSPEMAVPMTVKMPEPITAPMPSAVSDQGPSVFLRACSGSSESRISLSIDLRAPSCLSRAVLLVPSTAGSVGFRNVIVLGYPSVPDGLAEGVSAQGRIFFCGVTLSKSDWANASLPPKILVSRGRTEPRLWRLRE